MTMIFLTETFEIFVFAIDLKFSDIQKESLLAVCSYMLGSPYRVGHISQLELFALDIGLDI